MLLFLIDLKYIVAIEVLNNYIAAHNDMLSWVTIINTMNKYQIKGITKWFYLWSYLFVHYIHDYLSIHLSICYLSTVLSVNEYTPFEKYNFKQYLNENKNHFQNVDKTKFNITSV